MAGSSKTVNPTMHHGILSLSLPVFVHYTIHVMRCVNQVMQHKLYNRKYKVRFYRVRSLYSHLRMLESVKCVAKVLMAQLCVDRIFCETFTRLSTYT